MESRHSPSYDISDQSVNGAHIDFALSLPDLNTTNVRRGNVQSTVSVQDFTSEDILEANDAGSIRQPYFGSSQDILDWPVFEGKYDRRWIEALIFDPTLSCDDLSGPCTSPRVTDDSIRDRFEDPRQASGMGAGVREDDVPHLVESFLLNVHVKNPIFDPEYLRRMGKGVVENGFDWKAPTCLVVRTHRSFLTSC